MAKIIIIDRQTNKVTKFKSYYTASLYLILKYLVIRNKVYEDLINRLLYYWKTGATEIEFYTGSK